MKESLDQYLPSESLYLIHELINNHRINIKVVNQRKTKHGDFRKLKNGKFQITINKNLNKHQFLLTLVHEIAHHITFKEFGRVKPHGIEWKQMFQKLMLPFLHPNIFPDSILPHLAHYLKNPKASTDNDPKLSLALRYYKPESGKNFIFELPMNSRFVFKNKKYIKKQKRRTRYECQEIGSGRFYLFNQNAEVSIYEE